LANFGSRYFFNMLGFVQRGLVDLRSVLQPSAFHFPALFPQNFMSQITKDSNGQPCVSIRTSTASGRVHLHGATVTGWTPAEHEPVLWTSSKAVYDGQTPIRGGVPICTPWFGGHPTNPQAPSHGLARTATWMLDRESVSEEEASLDFSLELPGLKLSYSVLLGQTLKLALAITNTGEAQRRVEAALHTYLAVSDAREVTITGLENVAYLDKLGAPTLVDATGESIRFVAETDRVYSNTNDDVVLHDPGLNRQITVAKDGGLSTVIWNPWVAKAARMKDFGDDEWTGMCCIESAAVGDDAWTLASGATKTLRASVNVC